LSVAADGNVHAMTLFLILSLLIVVVAVVAAGGFFGPRSRTHIIERGYAARPYADDAVEEIVEEPVTTRRVVRRRVIR
jgi:hypothetical protein